LSGILWEQPVFSQEVGSEPHVVDFVFGAIKGIELHFFQPYPHSSASERGRGRVRGRGRERERERERE
jgi:hypothetical protein